MTDFDTMGQFREDTQAAQQDAARVAGAIWADIFPHNGRTEEEFKELRRKHRFSAIQEPTAEYSLVEVVSPAQTEVGDLLMVKEASGQEKRQYGRVTDGVRPWMTAREAVVTVHGYELYLVVGKTAKRLKVVPVRKPGQYWNTMLNNLKHASAHLNEPLTIDPSAATRQVTRLGVYEDILDRMAFHKDYVVWQNMLARATELDTHYNDQAAIIRNREQEAFAPKQKAVETINRLAGETLASSYLTGSVNMASWLGGNTQRLRTYLTGLMVGREWSVSDSMAVNEALKVLGWDK